MLTFFSDVLDVNECEAGVDNCPSNRQCMDTDGSFICTCFPGYKENEMSECISKNHIFILNLGS